jgi:hypothetical protein
MKSLVITASIIGMGALGYSLHKKSSFTSPTPSATIPTSISKPFQQQTHSLIKKISRENFASRPSANHTPQVGTSNTASSDSSDKPYEYFHNRLVELNKCFASECPFPQTDPKSYELAIYNEIHLSLLTLRTWQQRHNFKDERLSQLMTEFLPYEKAEIKKTALDILATQDPDERVVPVLLESVISYAQPDPIPKAMKELARYKDPSLKKMIDDTTIDVLTHGSVYSALEIAKNARLFVNTKNKLRYNNALKELSKQPLAQEVFEALEKSLL